MMKIVYGQDGGVIAFGPNTPEYAPAVPAGGWIDLGPPPPIDPNIVPQAVTRRQALLALLAAGKLDQIELLIQSAPRAVQIAWEAAGTFERDNPLIATLAPQLGLTDQDVDNLFIEAAKL